MFRQQCLQKRFSGWPFSRVSHKHCEGGTENANFDVIDSERCPLTFAEFVKKEYLRDRDGNWLDEIPDGQDHSIDAMRYAMMDDVLRG